MKEEMEGLMIETNKMSNELKNHIRLLEKKLVEKEDCVGKLERTHAGLKLESEDRVEEIRSLKNMIKNMEVVAVENKRMVEKLKKDVNEVVEKERIGREEYEGRVKELLGELSVRMAEGEGLKEEVVVLKRRLQEAAVKHDEVGVVVGVVGRV